MFQWLAPEYSTLFTREDTHDGKSHGRCGSRVAVLVDCDNTSPEILEYALRVVAQFGRVVLRRGYGNHSTLANKWQEALVRLAFLHACGTSTRREKHTSDLALALDAVRRPRDGVLLTSDSDFTICT